MCIKVGSKKISDGISFVALRIQVEGKGKAVPLQARCGPSGSRRFRLQDFHDIPHMKLVRSSASRSPGMYLVLIFTRGWIDPRAMVRSEGNMSLKNPVTPPGIDPGTVRLVAQPRPLLRIKVLLKTDKRTVIPAVSTSCYGVSSVTRRGTIESVTLQGVFFFTSVTSVS